MIKNSRLINNCRRNDYMPGKFIMVLFGIYAFFSFYEAYINKLFGAYTKYYIFIFMIILLFNYSFVKIRYYHVCILSWLLYKLLSTLWSWNGFNKIVSAQILSQFGMVALFCVLTCVNFDESSMRAILNIFKIFSFSMAILTPFFSKPYVSATGFVASDRVVLTLFNTQYDPNNMAAYFLVGISLALYSLLFERRQIAFNLTVFCFNMFALLQSASRGGFLSALAICLFFATCPLNQNETAKDKFKRVALMLAAAVIVYVVVFRFIFPDSLNRVLSGESYSGGSGRTEIWKNALEIFGSNPLFGGGWGSYYGYNGVYHAAHNTYVQSLCDTGIVGTILLFTPMVHIIAVSVKRKFYFPAIFIFSALIPAIFLDSINKRFFWNAIILSMMMLNSNMKVTVAQKNRLQKQKKPKKTSKYIKVRKAN